MSIESSYEFLLLCAGFAMFAVDFSFPRKVKYLPDGKVKHFDGDVVRFLTTVISGVVVFVATFIIVVESLDGSKDKVSGVITYATPRAHWIPMLFVLIGLYSYAIYKLCKESWAFQRRQSILHTLKKFGVSKDFNLERLDTFCRKYNLTIFPICYLEECIKTESECSIIKAMEKMEEELIIYDEIVSIRENINNNLKHYNRFKAIGMNIYS